MQDDQNDHNYDSEGGEFEKPKDEFLFYYKAFKIEEKKFLSHQRFEELTGKYWQLLRNDDECNISNPYIEQKLYVKLMKAIYKVLLPLYKEEEVSAEIAQEWIMDSKGTTEGLNFQQLTKILFRIAHQWATHIDLDEYVDLLNKIYLRIIAGSVVQSGYCYNLYPTYTLKFPQDEQKISDAGGQIDKGAQNDDWLECRSDESNKSDYEYKYEEDQVNMMVKKYKKMKNNFGNLGPNNSVGVTIKEPFVFTEEVLFEETNILATYKIADISWIVPFGYLAEQYFLAMKISIYTNIVQAKEFNKQEIVRLKREMREQNTDIDLSKYAVEEDSGIITDPTADLISGYIYTPFNSYMNCYSSVSSMLQNTFRRALREATNIQLRMLSEFPKPGSRSKSRTQLNSSEPYTELNKFGYNPALERRLSFKLMPLQSDPTTSQYVNINYLIRDPYLEALYRCDVQKVETKNKMAIKESEDIKKDEEFVNIETSFKRVRQIVLSKKFGTIFQDRTTADNKEQKRLRKIVEKEEKRVAAIMKQDNIAQKGLCETYEEKAFIKMMKGPFYQLDAKDYPKYENFQTCAEQDLIDAASQDEMRILIIGKPRSGKTTLAKNLAIKLDLYHINVDSWIAGVFEKIKNYEPPELEEGQEAPQFLSQLEDSVTKQLKTGQGPNNEQIVEIIRIQIDSPLARTKGYILDLPLYSSDPTWTVTIRSQNLLGFGRYGEQKQLSHVIELLTEDEEIKARAANMKVDPKDGVVYSRWEREERKKPKIIPEGEEEEEEENPILPLDESTLVQRINDTNDCIKNELDQYATERHAMDDLLLTLFDRQYIKIDSAGLTPDELTSCAATKIKPDEDLPLRPKAFQIENGSDFKSLLTEGLEENQIPRKWSYWKLVDPVALLSQKLIQGTAEFAASYHSNVFVFSSEENMKSFIEEPKKYLCSQPQMPSQYRVLMLGPKGIGKHTQAQYLCGNYGWRVIDFKAIVNQKIDEMSKLELHIPNNPLPGGRIGMSENELQEIIEGKAFPAWKFIPWIIEAMGGQIEKKRPPPPEPKDEEEIQQEELSEEEIKKKKDQETKKKKEEDEKKKKEEEEIQKQKEERRKRRQEAIEQGLDLAELGLENEDEEIIIIEDLPIDQLALQFDEATQKPAFLGGFILVGFPETEDQLTKLKEYGIEFDKVIYLGDTNEEDPGAEIKLRMQSTELYDYEQENEFAQKILGFAKDQFGDDIVKEINANGTQDDVNTRIKNEIDPFFIKVDNIDDVRTSADLGEDDKKLPKSDYGDYCPVTFRKENWLVRGNPEFEVIMNGKTYWFAGEKEANDFKFSPSNCLGYSTYIPIYPPPPKIMILGQKGSGVTTIIRMLCEKYKLDEFNLKDELLKKLKEEKDKRKRRRLLDRGFKPPLPPDEEGMEPPPDPEIEDDPEDFDRAQHERDVLKQILDSGKGLVIDGTWTDLPEDAVSQSLQDLLFESRRVPEIVIMFKCKEKSTFDRMIDFASIKVEYDNLMQKRETDRQTLREEDRKRIVEHLWADNSSDDGKTQEEKEEELRKWDEDRDAEDEAADENDPEKPNLDEMTEKFREVLRERREKDDAFIEEFGTVLKEKSVFVIDDIKTDISAEYVFIKILDRIKDNFLQRIDLIEKQQTQILKPEEVTFYEKSYIYKQSLVFGINSPITVSNPCKTKKYPVLYRERIYFLSDPQQQQQFLKEPSKYTLDKESMPLDIQIKPKLFVLGLPKSGKSTLCKKLSERTGVVHLKMTKVIQMFLDRDSVQSDNLRRILQKEGKQLEDDMLINLLLKRLQFQDCLTNGFVLEDFPKTRSQAILMAKYGLVPSNLFFLRSSLVDSYSRNAARDATKFGSSLVVYISRIKYFQSNIGNLLSFYLRFYNSVFDIDVSKSKWFVEDQTLQIIQKNLQARQQFSVDYFLRGNDRACKMKDMHMDRNLMKQSLSDFRYYCPVTWKNEKTLAHCVENFEYSILFRNAFYYFKGIKERDLFISCPSRFINNMSLPKKQDLPLRLPPHKAGEITAYEKALNGFCASTLLDEERVAKGDPILLVYYRDGRYIFESEYKLQKFLANPFKYSKAVLPVKMPPNEDKVSLYNLSKMEDSISFMEQALGQIVTRALREVSENRLKYPGISVKETMLKLFALFLKTNNPANTEYMKNKYQDKMKQFIQRCELSEEIYDLAKEKEKKKSVEGGWVEFKENNYNQLGENYDSVITIVAQEKLENFISYIR